MTEETDAADGAEQTGMSDDDLATALEAENDAAAQAESPDASAEAEDFADVREDRKHGPLAETVVEPVAAFVREDEPGGVRKAYPNRLVSASCVPSSAQTFSISRWLKTIIRKSSSPCTWSAWAWVQTTPSSAPIPASSSCWRMSGEVSTRTRVMPAGPIRSTSREQRRRVFLGFAGSHAPQ